MKAKKKFRAGFGIFIRCESVRLYPSDSNILIAYFSRWGNTDYPDDMDASASASIVMDGERFGTTEYAARMIQQTIGRVDFYPENLEGGQKTFENGDITYCEATTIWLFCWETGKISPFP